ncbi:MAG: hypothetical protein KC656_20595 [Myxococcales bacterium]|nr:hypothetical protein [Myxococcales bacterium]
MFLALLACSPSDPLDVEWRQEEVSGVAGVIGAMTAGGHVVGGLRDDLTVSAGVLGMATASPLVLETVADADVGRFCGCALHDTTRDEVVVFGGRDGDFVRAASAERIDLGSGEVQTLTGAEDVGTIGCSAVFAEQVGYGYVFGGGRGPFSADTWRYDPADGTLLLLDAPGPSARYDTATVQLPDGDMLIASGMGDGPTFHTDVWRFDVDTETWSELATSGDFVGRRFPFASLGPDAAFLYLGFGSDDPAGQSVLADLWALDLETGAWSPLETELPRARGFALSLPGPEGSLGTMAYGGDGQLRLVDDAWTLWVR